MRCKTKMVAGLLSVMAMLGTASAGAATAADWPFYGADLSNSRDGGSAAPSPHAVASLAQAWKFETSDSDFTGTPVVARSTVVAASNGGSIFALDAPTGHKRWARDVNAPIHGRPATDVA